MNILEAYDLTGSLRDAAELAGCSPPDRRTVCRRVSAGPAGARRAGGTVSVTARAAGGVTRIEVSDDGRGMSEPQQRAAFRRFASGTAGGTGLGLAIVNRVAVANGGSARLSDTPGGGLTVTIEFPLPGPQPGLQSGGRRAGAISAGTSASAGIPASPGTFASPERSR